MLKLRKAAPSESSKLAGSLPLSAFRTRASLYVCKFSNNTSDKFCISSRSRNRFHAARECLRLLPFASGARTITHELELRAASKENETRVYTSIYLCSWSLSERAEILGIPWDRQRNTEWITVTWERKREGDRKTTR